MKPHGMKSVERSCPPCDAGIYSRGILDWKRVFMCDRHKQIYDAADAADQEREAQREARQR